MSVRDRVVGEALGVVGAVAGGFAGYFLYVWMLDRGFYAMIAPGGLLGVGCGLAAREPSKVRGLVCAAAAIGLGLFAEWKSFPFKADESFLYLVQNAHRLISVHQIMIAVGAVVAYLGGKEGNLISVTRGRRRV